MPNHVLGYRGLRDIDAEFEQFSMNSWGSPERVGLAHPSDQGSDLWVNARPTKISGSALPSPVQPETLPMPTDHGLGFHNDQTGFPLSPEVVKQDPQCPVGIKKPWSFDLPLEDDQLMPQGQVLQDQAYVEP